MQNIHPKDYLEAMQWAVEHQAERLMSGQWAGVTCIDTNVKLENYRRRPAPVKPREFWASVRKVDDGSYSISHGWNSRFECESDMGGDCSRIGLFREVVDLPELTEEEILKIAANVCTVKNVDFETLLQCVKDSWVEQIKRTISELRKMGRAQ
jgi:hypothetical protein